MTFPRYFQTYLRKQMGLDIMRFILLILFSSTLLEMVTSLYIIDLMIIDIQLQIYP